MQITHRWMALAALCVLLLSCENDSRPRRVDRPELKAAQPALSVKVSPKELRYGDSLKLAVAPLKPTLELSEIVVTHADSRVEIARSNGGNIALSTLRTGGGDVRLRVDANFSDGSSSMRYVDFLVKASQAPQNWNLEIVRRYPHDEGAFTQGLLFHDGYLYEGTGNIGESRIRKVDMLTGEIIQERGNDPDVFGEGITIVNDKLYQLTYKTARGFLYNLEDFEPIDEFTYNTYTGEGWGLTHNDSALIVSDGSAYLYFLSPRTFEERKRIRVFDHRGSVERLNELEYADGVIYANIYTTAEIIAIDGQSGKVLHRYSARGLVRQDEVSENMDVLNGIAINPANGNLLITGKYWKVLYEVRPVLPS